MKEDHRTLVFLKNNAQQLRNYTYTIQSSLGVNKVIFKYGRTQKAYGPRILSSKAV